MSGATTAASTASRWMPRGRPWSTAAAPNTWSSSTSESGERRPPASHWPTPTMTTAASALTSVSVGCTWPRTRFRRAMYSTAPAKRKPEIAHPAPRPSARVGVWFTSRAPVSTVVMAQKIHARSLWASVSRSRRGSAWLAMSFSTTSTRWRLNLRRRVRILASGEHVRPPGRPSPRGRRVSPRGAAGRGLEGVGEDVVYQAEDQVAFQRAGAVHDLSGRFSLGEFCQLIDGLDLFPVEPVTEVSRLYRRWTFHSAALDLALRQAGRPLHEALDRPALPLTFVVSLRLGEPPTLEPIERRLARYPGLRFKLDPTSSWTPELIEALVRTGAVDSIDFKSFYRGTIVDQAPDPVLYRRVVEAFPDAWLEDPDVVTPATAEVLAEHHDRITWDAPIHSIADIEALPFPPRMVNIKPSRIGGLAKLCATYDYCAEHGIGAYGGGQFELGPGRGQAQYLASLFHADTPNDLAPVGYNENDPPAGLPSSPLPPAPAPEGFRWKESDDE